VRLNCVNVTQRELFRGMTMARHLFDEINKHQPKPRSWREQAEAIAIAAGTLIAVFVVIWPW
jgi:hypothetical protein